MHRQNLYVKYMCKAWGGHVQADGGIGMGVGMHSNKCVHYNFNANYFNFNAKFYNFNAK